MTVGLCVSRQPCVCMCMSVCVYWECVSTHFEHVHMNRRACLVGEHVV